MKLKGELKFENLVALQRDSQRTLDKPRKRLAIFKIVMIVLFVTIIFFINPSLQPIHIAINIVSTIIIALLLPMIINKAAVRIVRKSDNLKRIGPFSLYLSEEGIDIKREKDSKHVLWKEINHVTSDHENYFLYYGSQFAIVIPKNAITSDDRWIEYLSTYVGNAKIEKKKRVGLNKKQRSTIISLFVVILMFFYGVNYYSIKPEYDVSRATKTVSNLFVYTDIEANGENRIKETTDQAQVELALKELEKIDINKSRYKKYDLAMFGLYTMLSQAQEQLNQREGNQNHSDTNNTKQEFITNSDLSSVENLIENFPDLQSSFDEISWDIQGKILLPSLEDIPFNIEEVSIDYSNRPSANIYYAGQGESFTSSVWYYEEGLSQRGEEIQLTSGIVGEFYDYESTNSISIHWSDQEKGSKLLFGADLVSVDHEFTKEDIIKLANAMITNKENRYSNQEEEYIPSEMDVVLKNDYLLENVDLLEDFMAVAGENNESQIRVVKHVLGQGVIIYDLQSRYDKNADQGWIEVTPNLTHYISLENEVQDVFNNAPQQCGDMSKDVEEGYYKLYECRTNWEYRLLPIMSDIT